MYALDDHI
jgi:hypothetical protein